MQSSEHVPHVPVQRRWIHFDHDADIGVQGSGPTPAAAFEQAALAMTAIVTDAAVEPQSAVNIVCEAPELEVLFVDWLNALVFEMATRQMLFARFEVTLSNPGDWVLEATAWGEAVDRMRHFPTVEVKGATFTELSVQPDAQGVWHARCVVDV